MRSDPGLRATLASEAIKLRTVRSSWVVLGCALVVGVGLSALVALVVGSTAEELTAADRARFDSVGSSLVGVNFALVLFVVFGALAAGREYDSGMIRLTLTATPSRARLIAAKALAVAVPAWVLGVVTAMVAFVSGQAILRASDPALATGFDAPGVVASLVNWGTHAVVLAVVSLALAILFRSAAGAIATGLAVVFGPVMVSALVPAWVERNVLAWLPSSAASSLTSTATSPTPMMLDPAIAQVVVVAWIVGLLVLATVAARVRDSG